MIVVYSVFSFYSCSTDFEINAEKQDITVVYGLLDQNDSIQYVKITKAFLGDVSAYEMAKDPALSSYGDDIDVEVTETTNGNIGRKFYLQKTIITNKDTGIFYEPKQEVYYFQSVPFLKFGCTYQITITNKVTGRVTTASTILIKDFTIQKPAYNIHNPLIGFVNQNGEYGIYDAQWRSAVNGRLYEPYFRFHYKEVNKTTLKTFETSIDWLLSSVKSEKLDGSEDMIISYNTESFYKYLQAKIPVNTNLDRVIGNIEFIVPVGSDDLSIYIDLNKPSTSIVEERPAFTNIANGVGIFSSRYIKKLSFKFTQYSIDKLINGEYTAQLGFKE